MHAALRAANSHASTTALPLPPWLSPWLYICSCGRHLRVVHDPRLLASAVPPPGASVSWCLPCPAAASPGRAVAAGASEGAAAARAAAVPAGLRRGLHLWRGLQRAQAERRPQRFQAVMSGMDAAAIAAERHFSPHKARRPTQQCAAMCHLAAHTRKCPCLGRP